MQTILHYLCNNTEKAMKHTPQSVTEKREKKEKSLNRIVLHQELIQHLIQMSIL